MNRDLYNYGRVLLKFVNIMVGGYSRYLYFLFNLQVSKDRSFNFTCVSLFVGSLVPLQVS